MTNAPLDLKRAAWAMTCVGLVVEALALASVWGSWVLIGGAPGVHERDYHSPVGWAAAVAAAVIFGFCEVPIKIPESQDIGPTLFNAYSFIGNGLMHIAVALAISCRSHEQIVWRWLGAAAAFDITIVQAFARSAIWLLGIAVAPPLWCSIGMATSFAWGTVVFGDRPGLWSLSLLGLSLLIVGVALVSRASVLSRRCGTCDATPIPKAEYECQSIGKRVVDVPTIMEDGTPATQRERNSSFETIQLKKYQTESQLDIDIDIDTSTGTAADGNVDAPDSVQQYSTLFSSTALAQGFAYAACAGLADGSLTAFYQWLEGSDRSQASPRPGAVSDVAATFAGYLGSFGATMLILGSLIVMVALLLRRRSGEESSEEGRTSCTAAKLVPALASGALWAGANSCSVLSSHYLGMSLSFPLTQTAVVFCGLQGMLIFRELVGRQARLVFSHALAVIVVGAAVLSVFGQPSAQW